MKDNIGCFIVLILIVIVVGISSGVNAYKRSDNYMIKEARSQNDIENYELYIAQHPEGKHLDEAYDALFSKYSQRPSLEVINAYEHYKGSELGDKLHKLIGDRAQEDYNKAVAAHTEEVWSDFIGLYPEEFSQDAKSQLEILKAENEKSRWGTEAAAWKTASNRNTSGAYRKYLKLYPQGAHHKQAIDAQVTAILGEEHGELPPMDKTSYSYKSYSTISIHNSTSYTLTLLYSGKDSKQIVLSPGQQRTARFANGQYRIAASVDASNVRSYAGFETLDGSDYSVQYYISTSRY